MKKKLVIFIVILAVGGSIAILARTLKQDIEDKQQELKIAATIFPTYDIAKQIAGDDVTAIQIVPSGASPHTYEPTVRDKEKLSDTDLIFVIGLEFDTWAEEFIEGTNAQIIDLHEGIEIHEEDDSHGEGNPHYWLAPSNAKIISKTIYNTLVEQDPDNEGTYRNNYEQYLGKLNELITGSESKLDELQTRQIITFHDAFGYFAEEFDLEVVATIEPFAGKEPTPKELAAIGNTIQEYEIKSIFKEPQLSQTVVDALANDYNVAVYTLDPLGGVEGRNSYITLIQYNVDTMYTALT